MLSLTSWQYSTHIHRQFDSILTQWRWRFGGAQTHVVETWFDDSPDDGVRGSPGARDARPSGSLQLEGVCRRHRSADCRLRPLRRHVAQPCRDPLQPTLVRTIDDSSAVSWGPKTTTICVIVLMFYGCMQNAHYFILVFWWVGGETGSISPFSCFVSIDFSMLMYNSINNVCGQHRWLFAFLAACYELTLILCLCFSGLIPLLFVANKFFFLSYFFLFIIISVYLWISNAAIQ